MMMKVVDVHPPVSLFYIFHGTPRKSTIRDVMSLCFGRACTVLGSLFCVLAEKESPKDVQYCLFRMLLVLCQVEGLSLLGNPSISGQRSRVPGPGRMPV